MNSSSAPSKRRQAVFAGSFVAAAQTLADKQAEQELLRITREMIDTSLRGDKSAFERYTADTYIETGFSGGVATKTKILENFLTPPPACKRQLSFKACKSRSTAIRR